MQPAARTFLAALAIAVVAAEADATTVVIESVGATSQGFLYVDHTVDGPFSGRALEAIQSGLPSTLTYTVEVFRQRAGWWDKLEEAREYQFRVLRDLLNEQYVLASREEVRRFTSLDSLAIAACSRRRDYLRPLAVDKPHYVLVSFNLAPLSVADLRELEEWLQGTIRTGETSRGITTLSGTLVDLLLSATGFGDETAQGRAPTFVPEQVYRAQGVDPRSLAGKRRGDGMARPRRSRRRGPARRQRKRSSTGKEGPKRSHTARSRSCWTAADGRAPSRITQASRAAMRR
jgi:hypothetical protein